MRLGSLRAELVAAVRSLAAAGLWHGDASASARDPRSGWRLLTPAAVDAAELRPRDLVLVSAAGERLDGSGAAHDDAAVHLRVYAAVSDAGALVLSRPPLASMLADEALSLPPVSRRLGRVGGGVRCVPYAASGSDAQARLVSDALGRRAACLIAARGVIARGPTPASAVEALMLVERVGGAYAAALASGLRPRRLGFAEMARAVRYAGRPLRPRTVDALRRWEEEPWPDPAR